MKTVFFTISLLVAASLISNATVRTVSHTPTTSIGQFNTIQAAINASSSGDTVLVHGSPIQYSPFTIANKQLVVMGPGWSPDKVQAHTAQVNGGACIISGTASSGTEIHGMNFITGLTISSSGGHPNNIRIIRNRFTGTLNMADAYLTYSGYTFEGNGFIGAGVNAHGFSIYQNFVFRNNCFFSNGVQMDSWTHSLSTVLIDHNLFLTLGSGLDNVFNGCQFLVITNNIFIRRNAATSLSNSTFNNNITFNAGNNTPWLSNGNMDAGGNISNQDPLMADGATANNGTSNLLLNFTIASGPANNGGSDGKDIGLLYDASGSANWSNSRNSRLPRIYSMNITNPTIPSGGTLIINVEGRKSN
jgi:hypothetical protein